MIGLGSNRLTVCRRGGMSVTQAGRGGMEWLAGGREPLWAQWWLPYSRRAGEALKAQFPTQWPTIRDYGFAHPEIVPYVNANPLCAAIWCCYVQDGLVFQMDCNYECTAAKWKDVRSALEFIGTNVQIVDGVPYFGSNAKFQNTTNTLPYNYGAVTLEIIYKATVDNSGTNRKFFGVKGGSVAYGALSNNRGILCSYNNCQQFPYTTNAQLTRASVYSDSYAYFNEIFKTASGSNYWPTDTNNFIGNGGAYAGSFSGSVYGIRIYNRKLTEQEILANQTIDLQRWQAS